MKKTEPSKKQPKTSRIQDLFGTAGVETTLPVISDEQLSTATGGSGPKIPKNACD